MPLLGHRSKSISLIRVHSNVKTLDSKPFEVMIFKHGDEELYNKLDDVINNRVVTKIENEEDLENANVGKLYE